MKKQFYSKLVALLFCLTGSTNLFSQLTAWPYRDGINVQENAGSQKLDYQVLLTVNTASLVSAGKMQASGNDIRFSKNCNGSSLLNYFIESGMNTSTTQIWVMLDTLNSNGNYLLYMWYGNAGATAASSFNNTFPVATQLIVPTGTVTLSGTNNYSWFEVQTGATIVVGTNAPFTVNARVIKVAGTINANGKGALGGTPATNGSGPGAGKTSLGNFGTWGAGGASYGGFGGRGEAPNTAAYSQKGLHGNTYGTMSTDSIDMGSGGGGAASNGGAGGGAILLNGDVVDISGTINANGSNGTPAGANGGGGGGSGGGIKIKAARLTMIGTLSAKGVDGGSGGWAGGGGGGGRIKAFYDLSFSIPGIFNVSGGAIGGLPGPTDSTAFPGASGIVYTGTWLSKIPTYSFLPHVVLSSSATTFCAGTTATFTASAGFTPYDFYVNASSVQNSVSANFSSSALANSDVVKVLAGDAKGCMDTSNAITVTVNPLPSISVTPASSTICNGDNTALSASGATTYAWSPSSGLNTTSGANVNANPSSTTTYSINGTDVNGCSNTASVIITVNPLPVVSVNPVSTSICSGDSASLSASGGLNYTWSAAAGLNTTSGANVMSSPSGNTTYTVNATDANGCSNTATVSVTVNALPVVSINPSSASVCSGDSVSLTAGGAVNYVWSASAGLNTTNGASVMASPASSTTYTVDATDANGCAGSSVVSVAVNSLPVVGTTADTISICAGDSAVFAAMGGTSYSWSPASGLDDPSSSSVMASPSNTTTYTVSISDVNGCTNWDSVMVAVSVCMGAQEISLNETEFKLFPNPTNGIFRLQANFAEMKRVQIVLKTSIGQEIKRIENSEFSGLYSKEINVSELPAGIYFLQVNYGSQVQVKKIIKE